MLNSFDLSPFATGEPLPSPAASQIAAAIDDTLRTTGFLLVTGHGVDDDVREVYFDAMREFFALPLEQKEAIAIGNSDCHRGYVGFETESLDGALAGGSADEPVAGDLKETLDTGIDHGPDHPEVLAGTPLHGPNQWPDLPGFRERVEPYRDAMIEAVLRMQRAMSMALGLDPMFIEDQPGEPMYHLRLHPLSADGDPHTRAGPARVWCAHRLRHADAARRRRQRRPPGAPTVGGVGRRVGPARPPGRQPR